MALATDSLSRPPQILSDSLRTDTLREVVIRPDTVLPVVKAIDEALQRNPVPRTMSLADVLEKLSPGLNDKITHPFAFKQRQKERRHRRLVKVLEEYEHYKTFDDLLREAYERQMMEDSLQMLRRREP